MRLRGLVFERFVTFERAEVSLCDESGTPLDVVLFVGPSGSGKTSILRAISGILSEAAGGEPELGAADVRRQPGAAIARCRLVVDDIADAGRVVVTFEKELLGGELRGLPLEPWARWRHAMQNEIAPRAAFSIASAGDEDGSPDDGGDPLFDWLFTQRGGPSWTRAVDALDRVLWPYQVNHITSDGDIVFSSPEGLASARDLGDAFESVLVMTLELLRLSTERPNEDLVYVVDDIDAHLHPRWQSRLIGDLRRAFPRVQLVATTHSPYIAASVEPEHVFRVGEGNVQRVAERIARNVAVTPVMDVAFGAPDLPGPRWVHAPSPAIRNEVLRAIEDELPRGSVVYVLPELVHVRDVKNAFGEPVMPLIESTSGNLFFVDCRPGASWGHECRYVFRARDGRIAKHEGIWPPANLDRFVAIGRT